MDRSSNGNQEQWFPLLELPGELRNVIYRQAVGHAFPKIILPRWMQEMQRLHENTIASPVATRRLTTSSFLNLQLSSRQVYHEASYILYENCQFLFNVAPNHASFLDACLIPGHPTREIRDRSYTHRITNIVLKANWDGCDWDAIRNFSWPEWKGIMPMVCRELLRFSSLRRLTLDWRMPNPRGFLQPTIQQWKAISPYFKRLQARRPHILMEILAWQGIPGSIPLQYREIRTTFKTYAKELEIFGTPRYMLPVYFPNLRLANYHWPPYILRSPELWGCRWRDISVGSAHRPIIHPLAFCDIHSGQILAFSDAFTLFLTPIRNP